MNCPRCKSLNVYVTNTYRVEGAGSVQRRLCEKCGAVIITTVLVAAIDPPHGQGAKALVTRLRKNPPS